VRGSVSSLERGALALSVEEWQDYLSRELSCSVRVVYTRARRTPIQVRPVSVQRTRAHTPGPSARAIEVRMHSMFAAAPPDTRRVVATWIRSGRRAPRACEELDRWILAGLEELPPPESRARSVKPIGMHHDLDVLRAGILTSELAADFPDKDRWPLVTWGRRTPSRTRHSLRLGSFDADDGIARLHPVLDQVAVPRWFVRYVLFHELLHAVLPPRRGRGSRWIHHSAAFRKREHAYSDYRAALAWEDENMTELIRSARRGVPMRTPRAPAPVVAAPIKATPGAKVAPKKRGFWQSLLFPA
jgi:hypothetical protein